MARLTALHDVRRRNRALITGVSLLVIGAALGGCLGRGTGGVAASAPTSESAARGDIESWGKRYAAAPGEKTASLGYARALGALDQKSQAVAVLQAAAQKSPRDLEVLAAYGKALGDVGDYDQSLNVLAGAHSPDRPDWRVLSAQGIAADGLGQHDRAQAFYLAGLKIVPGEASLLSNLGLSYALSKRLPEAERALTEATHSPSASARMRQNLALVLALEGRFQVAEETLGRDLAPSDAAANVAEIRRMVAQQNTWSAIRSGAPAAAQSSGATSLAKTRVPAPRPAAAAGPQSAELE